MRINKFSRFLIITLFGLLQACSMIISSPEQANDNIDDWLAENNFSKIELTLNALNVNRAEYQHLLARKDEIEAKK